MSLLAQFKRCWLTATIGCVLFVVGSGLLFWNEGRAVRKSLSLEEALNDAVTVRADEPLQSIYDGRLIHITGPLNTGEPLTEAEYGILVQSVKLKKRVQMYQWVEETVEHNYADTVETVYEDKSYYYNMEWRDKLIDSRNFYMRSSHQNPTSFPISSQVQMASHVRIGEYELGEGVKDSISDFIEVTSDARPEDPSVKLHAGLYYHCEDIFNPQIGDIRIQFSLAGIEGEFYTIIGKLSKGKIIPYRTSFNSDVLLVFKDEYTVTEAFKKEHYAQKWKTWAIRFMGWVMLFFSATCTAPLLHILLSMNRFLSTMAPDLSSPFSANIFLSMSTALLITAISWVIHRPWVGFGLILGALSPFIYCTRGLVPPTHQRLS